MEASAREIQQFIHVIADNPYGGKEYELARTAIDVRISEDVAKSAEKLTGQLDRLVDQIGVLVLISEEQKKLAAKLEGQTKTLIRLTWAVVIFSIALLLFTAALYWDTHTQIQRDQQQGGIHTQ